MGRAKSLAGRLLRQGRLGQALRVLLLSFATDPFDPGTRLLLSRVEAAMGPRAQYSVDSDALDGARSALAMSPDDAAMWSQLASVYLRIHAQPQARAAARRAQQLDPTNWRTNVAVVEIDALTKKVTRSTRVAMAAALRLAPMAPEVHFVAAELATARDRPRAAIGAYRRVLELDPGNVAAINNIAVIKLGQGRLGESAGTFVGQLAQDPTSKLAFANLRGVARLALTLVDLGLLAVISLAFIPFTSAAALGLSSALIAWVPLATAAIATGLILIYVLWIRSRAGVYFRRFALSIPAVDKPLVVFAALIAAVVLALIVGVFTGYATTRHIDEGGIGLLILVFLAILFVANFRRTRA